MNDDKPLIPIRLVANPAIPGLAANPKFPIYLPFSAILCQILGEVIENKQLTKQ